MEPVLPSWFKQRQGKAESAGDNLFRLTAPNMGEAFIGIQANGDGAWSAFLRETAAGEPVAQEGPFASPVDGWSAAFELYRSVLVV
jgi:hypothetical protein